MKNNKKTSNQQTNNLENVENTKSQTKLQKREEYTPLCELKKSKDDGDIQLVRKLLLERDSHHEVGAGGRKRSFSDAVINSLRQGKMPFLK